jgi:acetyl-CoA acyltransferase 1
MNRLQNLNTQFEAQPTLNARTVGPKSDDDVVLVSFARTAMTRAKRGPQRDTPPEAMLAPVLKDVLKKANNMDPKLVEEICIGNVLQPGAGATSSRMAQFLAGIPDSTPLYAIDRLCSSGLQSVANIANQIRSNQIDIGIGGGVESMSMFAMTNMVDPNAVSDLVFDHPEANKCLMPMGITSENVIEKYGITRQQQDEMAVASHAKAAYSNKMGWSQKEITPYTTIMKDKDGNEKEVLVDRDDGIRP